jgi:hypothetical protein
MARVHRRAALCAFLDVPLDHDGARGRTSGREPHVCDLDGANVARFANLDDGRWLSRVLEGGSGAHEHGIHPAGNSQLVRSA